MFLWNLKSVDDIQPLVGLDGPELRKKLRLAHYDGKKLEYLQPVRVRTGWIDKDQFIVDVKRTGRPYGAHDELRPVSSEVVILVRSKD